MHHQFNIHQLYVLPTLYLCVFVDLKTHRVLYHLQHKLMGLCNRDGKFVVFTVRKS